jgi:hypothetical protein
MAGTSWTATFNGVNGALKEFTPSTIGISPLPIELQEQFNALARAAAEIISSKVAGYGLSTSGLGMQKFNVVLSGTGDSGHKGANTVAITITQV